MAGAHSSACAHALASTHSASFPLTMMMRRLTSGAAFHAYAEQGARACVQYEMYRMGWCMVGFNEAKQQVIRDLQAGNFVHEVRRNISSKNLLLTGGISASDLAAILKRARGQDHRSSPHHRDADIQVHEILAAGWYVKFYFLSDTTFISVHRQESIRP